MKCPGCGENNEVGMQFCIICGHSLSAPAPAPAPVASMPMPEEMQISGGRPAAGPMVLVCTVCNKTDPLNGIFCVYCGGRTVVGPAPSQVQSFTNVPVLSGGHVADVSRQSEEIVRNVQPRSSSSGGSTATIIGVVLALIIGAGGAIGATTYLKGEIEKSAVHSLWPKEGVLLYSKAGNADLAMEDTKKKSLIFGKTAADGSLYIPSVSPGSYVMNLSDSSGKSQSSPLDVNVGEPNIIGYPARLELK